MDVYINFRHYFIVCTKPVYPLLRNAANIAIMPTFLFALLQPLVGGMNPLMGVLGYIPSDYYCRAP